MNNFFAFFALSLTLSACASSPPVVSSTYKIKGQIVEGTTWLYDKDTKTYVWLTDEGNKFRVIKTIK